MPIALPSLPLLRLYADPGRLDDRPPFVDFGFLERGEAFRRLLRAGCYVEPQFGKALLDRRIGQRLDGRGVQFGDDVLRRAFGAKKPNQPDI